MYSLDNIVRLLHKMEVRAIISRRANSLTDIDHTPENEQQEANVKLDMINTAFTTTNSMYPRYNQH
jgi:hypothetical protein